MDSMARIRCFGRGDGSFLRAWTVLECSRAIAHVVRVVVPDDMGPDESSANCPAFRTLLS